MRSAAAKPVSRPSPGPARSAAQQDRHEVAYWLLRIGFVALPLIMGLDKFTNELTSWTRYLAPWIVELLPFSAQTAMYVVGLVEIVAAFVIAIKPRYGAPVVAAWLGAIIVNLVTYPGFYDVALRDVGLLIAALALARLAATHERTHPESSWHLSATDQDVMEAQHRAERWFPANVLAANRSHPRPHPAHDGADRSQDRSK